MPITREQRTEAYESASAAAQELCGGLESGRQLRAIATKHGITDPEQYRAFALAVGDIALGFYTASDIEKLLREEVHLNNRTVETITPDIRSFLTPLHRADGIAAPAAQTAPVAAPESSDRSTNDGGFTADIAETEAALERLQQVHTYASDQAQMNTENASAASSPRPKRGTPETNEPPTHSSSQRDLFQTQAPARRSPSAE